MGYYGDPARWKESHLCDTEISFRPNAHPPRLTYFVWIQTHRVICIMFLTFPGCRCWVPWYVCVCLSFSRAVSLIIYRYSSRCLRWNSSDVLFSQMLCSIFMEALNTAIKKAYRLENGYGSPVVEFQCFFLRQKHKWCARWRQLETDGGLDVSAREMRRKAEVFCEHTHTHTLTSTYWCTGTRCRHRRSCC